MFQFLRKTSFVVIVGLSVAPSVYAIPSTQELDEQLSQKQQPSALQNE